MSKKLKRTTFIQIEQILKEYKTYSKIISERKLDLLYPYQEADKRDDNIGGGRSNKTSQPTEDMALKLATDKQLNRIEFQKKAIEKVYNNSSEGTQKVIKEYYFTVPRTKSWAGIAEETRYSRRQCFRLRDQFFNELADELGMIK